MHASAALQHVTSASLSPSSRRRPVKLARRLTLGDLDTAARAALVEQLWGVYRVLSDSLDREQFERFVLPSGDMRVAIFEGADGELAGFSAARILRVREGGREHAVFTACVNMLPGYRGGAASAIFGLTEALRFKMRHPRIPLSYVSLASNAAAYQLFARTLRRFWPRRGVETPPEVENLVRAVAAARGIAPLDGDPWRARAVLRPRAPERLAGSRALRDDADAAFFHARNPRYAEGEGSALAVFIPLDLADIAHGLAKATWEMASSLFTRRLVKA
ncbi:MAG: hypothetical protein QM820_00680 [Minicystis sp.]